MHLRRARDHADRHYAEPVDLDTLAAVAGLSRYHFLRLFRATYGITPAAYVSQRRIERAQDLLRATNLTVTEVCHAVGFTSLGSFSARFLEVVGETPTAFQRRYAAGAPHIPGCYVFMWGLAETRRAEAGRTLRNQGEAPATGPLLRSGHDHEHQHRQRLRPGPGRVEEVLHRGPRVRGEGRHHARGRVPLVHRRAPGPARAPGQPRRAGAAAGAGDGRGDPALPGRGSMHGLGLTVDDCRATFEELSAKGVEFMQPPRSGPTAPRPCAGTTRETGSSWSSPATATRPTTSTDRRPRRHRAAAMPPPAPRHGGVSARGTRAGPG